MGRPKFSGRMVSVRTTDLHMFSLDQNISTVSHPFAIPRFMHLRLPTPTKRKMARYHQMTLQRRNALVSHVASAIFFDHNMPLGPGNDPGDDLFETETRRDQQVPACSSSLVMNSLLSVLSLSLVQGFSSCTLWPHLGTWNYSVVVCFSVPRHQQQGFNNQIMDLIP